MMEDASDDVPTMYEESDLDAAQLKPACPICRDLDKRKIRMSDVQKYDRAPFEGLEFRFKTIEKSAARGCQLCYALVVAAKQLAKPDLPSRCVHSGAGGLAIRLDAYPIQISAVLPYVSKTAGMGIMKVNFELFTDPYKPSPWPVLFRTNTPPPNLHSTKRTKMVRNWIAACDASHQSCNPNLFPNDCGIAPPRRILEISRNPRTGLRLIDFSSNAGPYVAVVHASISQLEAPLSATTSNNIKNRENIIQWWQIPVALQETITIAHEQNVRYIWIQDYCVIQDDTEDQNWHMDRQNVIYGRSHFTIALPDTKDLRISNFVRRRSGCKNFPFPTPMMFDPFQPQVHQTVTIPLSHKGQQHFVYARPSIYSDHRLLSDFKLCGRTMPFEDRDRFYGQDSTFQGIISSSRVLYLRSSEMSWECGEAEECECEARRYNHGSPAFGAGGQYPGHPSYLDLLAREGSELPETLIRQQYMQLISTDPSGKLDRIGSLLRQCSQLSCPPRHMNFAGMLVQSPGDLVHELLWTFVKPQVAFEVPDGSAPDRLGPSPLLETYRYHTPKIPTWSWASMVLCHYETICSPKEMYSPYRQLMGTWSTDESFVVRRSGCDPDVGGRGDTFLAGNWVLEVSGKMATAEFTSWQVLGAVNSAGDTFVFKTMMPIHPVPPLKPTYDGSFFQPDCSQWPKSVNPEDPLNKRVNLLLVGRVQVADISAAPGCDSKPRFIDVGLVLRKSSRNYAKNAYERLGTFVALAEHDFFEGCSGTDITLV